MELSDSELEAALEAFDDEKRRELFRTYDLLTPADFDVAWNDAPPQITIVDGVERRVFQMPYPLYSDKVHILIRILAELVITYPVRWMDWDALERYPRPEDLRTASVADAARVATILIRGERFCDGRIAGALKGGIFAAMMDRLRTWYDERPG